jgi:hypothetical protein
MKVLPSHGEQQEELAMAFFSGRNAMWAGIVQSQLLRRLLQISSWPACKPGNC